MALAGCTEHLDGFEADFSDGSGFSLTAKPPSGNTMVFTVRRKILAERDRPRYARPHGATLKIDGYMPVLPFSVSETGDTYTVEIRLPEDFVRDAKSNVMNHRPVSGELILPVDTGITSFAGIEHFIAGTAYVHVRLLPAYSGPMSSMAKNIGESLRGLYSAR